jgi:hypothetical protein
MKERDLEQLNRKLDAIAKLAALAAIAPYYAARRKRRSIGDRLWDLL